MRTLALVLAPAPLPAGAYSLTATEECWYKYDPSFRDWVDNFQGKVRHGDLTMKKAYRLHRAAWPNAPHGSRVDEGQTSPLSRARSLYVENRVRLTARTCACRSTRRSAVRFRVLADEPIEKSLRRGSASPAQSTLFIGASPCPSPPSPLKLHRISRKLRMSGVVRHP